MSATSLRPRFFAAGRSFVSSCIVIAELGQLQLTRQRAFTCFRTKLTNKILIAFLLPALAVTLWGVFTYWKFRIPHGIDFARLEVVSLEGKRIRFSELATKSNTPVIVIFGQSWCHDCHSDMLSLHTARARFYPRSRVLILSDEYSSTVRAWQKEMHLPFEYFQLTQPLDELGVFAYPTTYVLGENLRVVYSKVGSVEWQSQEIRRLFP